METSTCRKQMAQKTCASCVLAWCLWIGLGSQTGSVPSCQIRGHAGGVHQACEQSLHILVVARGARIHDFNIATHPLQKRRNVGIHTRCFVCIVFCAHILDKLGDVILEKRRQEDLVLVVQAPDRQMHPTTTHTCMISGLRSCVISTVKVSVSQA